MPRGGQDQAAPPGLLRLLCTQEQVGTVPREKGGRSRQAQEKQVKIYNVHWYNQDGESDGYFAELSEKELQHVTQLLRAVEQSGNITDLEIYPLEDNVIGGKDLISEIRERYF